MEASKTVLIVDDSRVSRMIIRTMINNNRPEWTVIEASCSDEALVKVASATIDLMILDHNMPGMLGMDLAAILKKQFPQAMITLLTANIQQSTQERAAELGINFTKKPVSEEKIERILDSADQRP